MQSVVSDVLFFFSRPAQDVEKAERDVVKNEKERGKSGTGKIKN